MNCNIIPIFTVKKLNKMKPILFLSILLLLQYSSSNAQRLVNLSSMGETFYRIKEAPVKDIEGSPNLNENWKSGLVKMIGSDEINIDSLNLDIYSNKLMFQSNGLTYSVSDNNNVEHFVIGNSIFVNLKNPDFKGLFFELLSNGSKIKLLKLYKCDIVKGNPSNGIIPAVNDKFRMSKELYVLHIDKGIRKLSGSKNDILNHMNDKKSEIEKFVKENKINIKKEKDLIELFNHYNTL